MSTRRIEHGLAVDPTDCMLEGVLENLIEIAKRMSYGNITIQFYTADVAEDYTTIHYWIDEQPYRVHAKTIRGAISLMADYNPKEYERALDEYSNRTR